MKYITSITETLKSRLFRNILFWSIVFYFLVNNHAPYQYPAFWYYFLPVLSLGTIMLIVYVNNLYLIPQFLRKKKRKEYILNLLGLSLVVALIYTCLYRYFLQVFPLIKLYEISPLAITIHKPWTPFIIFIDTISYLIGFLFWTFLFTLSWYTNNYFTQEKNIEDIKKKQTETELIFLKSQINPHFLFNNLNNLYGLAILKSDLTADAILKLSSLLRYLLYESNSDLISFEEEKEVMQAYIDLELLRFPQNSDFNFYIYADKNYNIPPLLWLSVLENLFKHGGRIISEKQYIDFKFIIENDRIHIFSKNYHKPPLKKDTSEKVGGIGLVNLQKRLDLLYHNKYTYTKSIENNFYIINIDIQLN